MKMSSLLIIRKVIPVGRIGTLEKVVVFLTGSAKISQIDSLFFSVREQKVIPEKELIFSVKGPEITERKQRKYTLGKQYFSLMGRKENQREVVIPRVGNILPFYEV